MQATSHCPCCSESMLRHARHGSIYWFCSHCWQEMPDLMAELQEHRAKPLETRRVSKAGL